MKFKAWEAALLTALLIFAVFTVADNRQNALSDKMIRLHVVANSDDDEDQALKLKVRDAVCDCVSDIVSGCDDKNQAEKAIKSKLSQIEAAAKKCVADNGFTDDVIVTMKNEIFPTRDYDTFSLPAGKYDALRVTIGSGEGHNWWCVVFPPVCSSGIISKDDAVAVGLTEDDYRLITGDGGGYVVKFRTIEIAEKVKAIFER